jgi:hypothetical protein
MPMLLFKTFESERRFETANGTDSQEENSKLYSGVFKGLSPSTTPLERENLLGLLNKRY